MYQNFQYLNVFSIKFFDNLQNVFLPIFANFTAGGLCVFVEKLYAQKTYDFCHEKSTTKI